MYHYVRPIKGSKYEGIKGLELKKFIEEIDYLSKNYQIISSLDLIEAIKAEESIPNQSVILTFDDGYLDHYKYVFPELQKRNLSGTFFPIAKAVTDNLILDVNKIHYILASQSDTKNIFDDLIDKIKKNQKKYRLNEVSAYLSKYFVRNRYDPEVVNFIKRVLQFALPQNLRSKIVKQLFNKYVTIDESGFSEELYASEPQLKEMLAEGMIIGSHGTNHLWLDSTSVPEQEQDIKDSVLFLDRLGSDKENLIFCYPYGAYNQQTLDILKSVQCKGAFTTTPRKVNLNRDNVLEIPRIDTNDVSAFL